MDEVVDALCAYAKTLIGKDNQFPPSALKDKKKRQILESTLHARCVKLSLKKVGRQRFLHGDGQLFRLAAWKSFQPHLERIIDTALVPDYIITREEFAREMEWGMNAMKEQMREFAKPEDEEVLDIPPSNKGPQNTGKPIDESSWSQPRSPSEWAENYDVSWDTLKKRFDKQQIRNQRLSLRAYRVHVDDLPDSMKSE